MRKARKRGKNTAKGTKKKKESLQRSVIKQDSSQRKKTTSVIDLPHSNVLSADEEFQSEASETKRLEDEGVSIPGIPDSSVAIVKKANSVAQSKVKILKEKTQTTSDEKLSPEESPAAIAEDEKDAGSIPEPEEISAVKAEAVKEQIVDEENAPLDISEKDTESIPEPQEISAVKVEELIDSEIGEDPIAKYSTSSHSSVKGEKGVEGTSEETAEKEVLTERAKKQDQKIGIDKKIKLKTAQGFTSLMKTAGKAKGAIGKTVKNLNTNMDSSLKKPVKVVSAIDEKITKSMKKVVQFSDDLGDKKIPSNIKSYDKTVTRSVKEFVDSVCRKILLR